VTSIEPSVTSIEPKVASIEPKEVQDPPTLNNKPDVVSQEANTQKSCQPCLDGYRKDPMMPSAPTWNDMLATFELVAKVRFHNPYLADYLMIHMNLAHQATFNPLVYEMLPTNPNIAHAMILNPELAHLLWLNPELAPIARNDIMLNILARTDPWLVEYLLRYPSLAAITRRNWMDSVQFPHYDLFEIASDVCCQNRENHNDRGGVETMDDIDLDDLNLEVD